MRVALISDIHGNRVALEGVLDDLEGEIIDRVVCLGDIAATGPEPVACIEEVAAMGCPVVLGNTDEDLLGETYDPKLAPPDQDLAEINAWCLGQLGDEDRDHLHRYVDQIRLDIGGVDLFCCHGTPASNVVPVFAQTPGDELAEIFDGVDAGVIAFGHTHEQVARWFDGSLLVNPGSVGLPFQRDAKGAVTRWPLCAQYAILEHREGRLSTDLRRVPVDLEDLELAVKDSGMPNGQAWLARWG